VILPRALAAIGLAAAVSAAQADEPRTVPAIDTKLTYRLVSSTKTADKTITTGEIYTYVVTASDNRTAEGIIKPTAMILHCTKDSDILCEYSAKAPGAHYDGDMLTVPITSDSSDSLAKQSYFKLVHFLTVSRKFPVPASRDSKDASFREYGPDPVFVLTNAEQCDPAGLEGFLPFGKSPKVTLSCETTFERTASPDGRIPASSEHDTVAIEIAYAGNGWITVPSGSWQVHKLATKMTPKDPGRPASESEILFSTQLGALVRSHTIGRNPSGQSMTENTVELVSVAP
jgi:hypothetical protein